MVTYDPPVGPLNGGQTYYLNFEIEASNPKAFYLVKGAHHNNLYVVGGGHYLQRLKGFVRHVLG